MSQMIEIRCLGEYYRYICQIINEEQSKKVENTKLLAVDSEVQGKRATMGNFLIMKQMFISIVGY